MVPTAYRPKGGQDGQPVPDTGEAVQVPGVLSAEIERLVGVVSARAAAVSQLA